NVVFRTGNAAMFTILTEVNTITPPNGYGPDSAISAGGWAFPPYDMMQLPGDIYNRNLVEPIDDPTGFLPHTAVAAR
ncbi:MAG TPA: hypothetical protein VFA69_05450, partial [Candidatus Nitrosotalea sp.]|nr:hypothetical protein [Candidatus Nitrosotalea sp.]